MPNYLSSDNDPLYRFHQWQANLRVLEVTQIKSIPYVPLSHPFVERLIGTFVMDNKSAVLWRSPLCGVRARASNSELLRYLNEHHITDRGSKTL